MRLVIIFCITLLALSCKSSQTKSNYKSIGANKIICFEEEIFFSNRDVFFKALDSVGANKLGGNQRFQILNFIAREIEDQKKVKIYHRYRDSLIISYKTQEDKMIGDYTVISTNNGTYSMLAKKDSSTFYMKNKPYFFIKESGFEIIEYRNIKKEIAGFECFKVVVRVLENTPNTKEYITYNLFVTEKISSLYHPTFNIKSVLEKYYPLEINESNSSIKGIETISKMIFMN